MSLSLKIANFEDKGKQVPYLVSDDKIPGGKYLFKTKQYGVSPNLILAILDEVEVGDCDLRTIAQEAIDQAEQFNNPPPKISSKVAPVVKYWLAVGNQPSGPYAIDELTSFATADSLICQVGSKQWVKASTVLEFDDMPPPPPAFDDEPEYEDDVEDIAQQIKNQLVGK